MAKQHYYYAFLWTYGVGTWRQNSDGTESMPGRLYVFASKSERDDWVAADKFDNNWYRSSIPARLCSPRVRG